MIRFLCVKSLLLLNENKECTRRKGNSKNYQTCQESQNAVNDDKAKYGSTYGACCPCDITSLYAHEFKWFLKTFEHWVAYVMTVLKFCCHNVFLFFARQVKYRRTMGEPEQQPQGIYMLRQPS